MENSGMTGLQTLAPELIAHVMTYLEFDDVLKCSRVSPFTLYGIFVDVAYTVYRCERIGMPKIQGYY